MRRTTLTAFAIFATMMGLRSAEAQTNFRANPTALNFSGTADSDPSTFTLSSGSTVGQVQVDADNGMGSLVAAKFKLTAVQSQGSPASPAFALAYPSSGTTSLPSSAASAVIQVALNPTVVGNLSPGGYANALVFSSVDQTPQAGFGIFVVLFLSAPPPPAVKSVLSTASYKPEVSPGEIVSIIGRNLGPQPLSAQFDPLGFYPTSLGSTTVTFDGTPASLLYVSQGQINAIAPYSIAGNRTTSIVVTHYGKQSAALAVPVSATTPGIYTANQTGTGQGAIIQFAPDMSYNSADNPAPTIATNIELFATGAGVWNPPVVDSGISISPVPFSGSPVSLTVGGKSAPIFYAGSVPFQSSGLLQVNATLPPGLSSGPQPVVLRIGNTDNAAQNVTIAIK